MLRIATNLLLLAALVGGTVPLAEAAGNPPTPVTHKHFHAVEPLLTQGGEDTIGESAYKNASGPICSTDSSSASVDTDCEGVAESPSESASFTSFAAPSASYGTFPISINESGEIAGYYHDSKFGSHGFVRDRHGTITAFDVPGAVTGGLFGGTIALGINEDGAIAGYYTDAGPTGHGFTRDRHGTIVTFDASGASGGFYNSGTIANSVNDEGAIAGYYTDFNGLNHGFVRDKLGSITEFDVPKASSTSPQSISASGLIAGFFGVMVAPFSFTIHGFVRDTYGTITTFDAPGASYGTYPLSVSRNGSITGYYYDAAYVAHGFVRDGQGVVATIDIPGARGTFAQSINRAGVIVGWYRDASYNAHGFVRNQRATITSFDFPGTNTYTVAICVNEEGAITGQYVAGDSVRGFVLSER